MLLVGSAVQARTGPASIEADGAVPDLAAADGAEEPRMPEPTAPPA
jgi:hypothetical protein